MATTLIDGKALAARLRQQLTTEVEELRQRGVVPGLAVVLVGDDPASRVYVSMKEKACAQVGIFSAEHRLPAETSQQQLLELIGQLNQDRRIDGILV
ncbi:MAG: tetrahydrofolate dehydrogenase/cyclohydrolase catalytic domain-containing protein, partial [Desulfuromonas thiophila]|nr:tetrahydrofolate dehydrogenase/cyclohydrolase catalytic domain-containing protein [Desulfuromonas thiophila]